MRDLEADEPQRGIKGVVNRLARRGVVKFSGSRTIDGLLIIGDKGADKIVEALHLIRDFDPIRYKRLLRDVRQVLVATLPASVANGQFLHTPANWTNATLSMRGRQPNTLHRRSSMKPRMRG